MNIEVKRSDLPAARAVAEDAPSAAAAGTIVARVDRFALTTNNVTYAAIDELIPYLSFYPASDPAWGRVPVWGYATITSSAVDGLDPGDRFFGFLPMSDHVVLEPTAIGRNGFDDATAHRAALPEFYNHYVPARGQPASADEEVMSSALHLFGTGFLLDEWLASEDFFGAASVVISSASSKTALALGFQLRQRDGIEVVGLTSARNADFVTSTGAVDRVVPYDDVPAGLGGSAAVFVDLAGNAAVTAAVHEHFGDLLERSVIVGLTHRADPGNASLPGPAPELFFAPDHRKRIAGQWGNEELASRIGKARANFVAGPGRLFVVVHRAGADEVIASWRDLVNGDVEPREVIGARL